MRKLFLLVCGFILTLSVSGQELILPCAPNNDSTLSYTFKVVSDKYPQQALHLERQMMHYFKALNYNVTVCEYGLQFSDLNILITEPNVAIIDRDVEKFDSNADMLSHCVKVSERRFNLTRGTRAATTVFKAAGSGYAEFRIPSIVVTGTGRIVAFAEARAFSKDQAHNKIVARYSDNGGAHWSDLIVVDNQGDASLNNPCTVVHGGRIMMIYNCYPPNVTEGNTKKSQKNYYVYSDNGGETWSTPVDITSDVMHPLAISACSGPGAAIVVDGGTHHGRIVVPFNGNGNSHWFNYLVYSDDNGATWQIAKGISAYGTNESQIVQITDSTFLVNARSHRNIGDTSYEAPSGWNAWDFSAITRNRANMYVTMRGDSVEWSMPQIMTNQPDPTCQGSIISTKDGLLWLSNSASEHTYPISGRSYAQTPPMRVNGMLKVSKDNGQSWVYAERIYGNRFTEFQYSALAGAGRGVYCLFETNPDIRFTKLDGYYGPIFHTLRIDSAALKRDKALKDASKVR